MIWWDGSTLAPNRRTTSPSTSTRPSPIRSSQCLRLPSPAAASTFCSRTPASGWPVTCLLTLKILDVGEERHEIGQLVELPQADALKEVTGRSVEDRSGLRFR